MIWNTSFQGNRNWMSPLREADGCCTAFYTRNLVPVQQQGGRLSYTRGYRENTRGNRNNNKDLFVKSTAACGINSVLTLCGGGCAATACPEQRCGGWECQYGRGRQGVLLIFSMRHATASIIRDTGWNYQKFVPLARNIGGEYRGYMEQQSQGSGRFSCCNHFAGDNGTLSAGISTITAYQAIDEARGCGR